MACIFDTLILVLSLLSCLAKVSARSELCVIFENAPNYKQLNQNQKNCAANTISSVAWMSTCRGKDCFCADPQFMSDETDKCMIALGRSYAGMYSTDTYNGIMTFFANECGTFEVQLKEVASQSIQYTRSFTQAPLTRASGTTPVVQPADATQGPGIVQSETKPVVSSSSSSGEDNRGDGGLGMEAIIGIIAGVATVLGTMIAAYMCLRRRRG